MSLNGEKLLNRMSDVDSTLIISAESVRKSKKLFIKIGAVAASVAVAAAVVGLGFIPKNGSWTPLRPEELPELPSLKVGVLENNGMGFAAYRVSELEKKKEKTDPINYNFSIREMPVYSCRSADPDVEQMRTRMREVIDYFGLDYDSLNISEHVTDEQQIRDTFEPLGAPEEEIQRLLEQSRNMTSIYAREKEREELTGISIDIDASLTVSIILTHPEQDDEGYYSIEAGGIEFPKEYNFALGVSAKEEERTGRYLLEKFSGLIDMKEPVFVKGSEYDYGELPYAEFYEKGETDAESIANQNIKRVAFYGTEDGRLKIIRIWEEYRHCEKLGDYPISNLEQATELLRNGSYYTNSPYELTGKEEIGFVELTYWSGYKQSCAMPFYCFYVKLPEEEYYNEHFGEGEYGFYYVPAVRGEYLENFDTPTFYFN